jgi:single-strand DNA-binding protein
MYNKAIIMDRICHDLELKTTPTGVSVMSFRLAVDRKYQVKGEERKVDFFNIVAWRSTAEFISKYFSKGRMIMLDGELQTRQYVDRNNITQNIVEIIADSIHFTGEKPPQTQNSSPVAVLEKSPSYAAVSPVPPPTQTPSAPDNFNETANEEEYPF